MTLEEFAKLLDGREYGQEITKNEEEIAKDSGLVVIFGASDDLAEIRGAVHGEASVYDGGFMYLTKTGLLENKCSCDDCVYFQEIKKNAMVVEAVWANGNLAWSYRTTVTHATFTINEDGDPYCRGIVFPADALPSI